MPRRTNIDLGWIHYPANDLLPEHYSCPFGVVIFGDDGRWEAFATTAMYSRVRSPEQLAIAHSLGFYGKPEDGKKSVAREFARTRRRLGLIAA